MEKVIRTLENEILKTKEKIAALAATESDLRTKTQQDLENDLLFQDWLKNVESLQDLTAKLRSLGGLKKHIESLGYVVCDEEKQIVKRGRPKKNA